MMTFSELSKIDDKVKKILHIDLILRINCQDDKDKMQKYNKKILFRKIYSLILI